jgi:hypothetical protein
MVPRTAVVDDLGVMTGRSPVVRRSVLKSRQDYEFERDDENASIFRSIAIILILRRFCLT